jgi:hypothetical protein
VSRPLPHLALALLLAGCGLIGGEAADFRVGSTVIVDAQDLVRAAEEIEAPAPDAVDGVLLTQSRGRLTELEVSWLAHSCSPGTTLRIPEGGLRLEVERAEPAEGCEGTLVVHAVRLELGVAIDVEEVRVSELGAPVGESD